MVIYIRCLLTTILIFQIAGCATAPRIQSPLAENDGLDKPGPLSDNLGRIFLLPGRSALGVDLAARFYINGNEIGRVSDERYLAVDLPPGQYSISSDVDTGIKGNRSIALSIELHPAQEKYVKHSSSFATDGWKMIVEYSPKEVDAGEAMLQVRKRAVANATALAAFSLPPNNDANALRANVSVTNSNSATPPQNEARQAGKPSGTYSYTNNSKYEGPLTDGKPDGIGKITYANGATYEGPVHFGLSINGKGVFTWPDSARYEGDFLNGKRTGQGVLLWPNGDRHEGAFLDDKRTGKAVFVKKDGLRYEGDYKDDVATGQGVLTKPNGDQFTGTFISDKPISGIWRNSQGNILSVVENGVVTQRTEFAIFPTDSKYEGPKIAGKPNGVGKLTYANGNVYEGPIQFPKPGKTTGRLTFSDGGAYQGEFFDLVPNGTGTLVAKNGYRYEGQVKAGLKAGIGKATFPSGDVYEGEFLNGKMEGRAKLTTPTGLVFEGTYLDDKPKYGKLAFPNGDTYEGDFANSGERTGRGVYIVAKNGTKYEGDFKQGKAHGSGRLTNSNGDYFVGTLDDGKPKSGTWYNSYSTVIAEVENGTARTRSSSSNNYAADSSNAGNRFTEAVGTLLGNFAQGVLMGVIGAKTGAYGNASAQTYAPAPVQQQPQITRVQGVQTVQPSGQNPMGPRCTMYRDDGSGTCVLWSPN